MFERIIGLIGEIYDNPSPSRDLRLMMRLDRITKRQSVKSVNQCKFDKIIIAHGQLIIQDTPFVFTKDFSLI